jgi:hypothetical protein
MGFLPEKFTLVRGRGTQDSTVRSWSPRTNNFHGSSRMAEPVELRDQLERARAALVAAMADRNHPDDPLPQFWDSWLYPDGKLRPKLSPLRNSLEPKPRFCLLLTGSTQVQVRLDHEAWGVNQQRNRTQRRAMYRQNVRTWLKTSGLPIVFVDTTNDPSFIDGLRADLVDDQESTYFASVPKEARKRVELLALPPSRTCSNREIGCHEAAAILSAVQRSAFFRRAGGRPPKCTHAVKVTGRYHVPVLPSMLDRCSRGVGLVVESSGPPVNGPNQRQETMVLGFDARWTEALFGWSAAGGMCQECHIGQVVKVLHMMRARDIGSSSRWRTQWVRDVLCVLPPMRLSSPTKEGSTGRLRMFV